MKVTIHTLTAAALAIACVAGEARAQTPAEFFKGRSINLLIGSGEGGGFDASARLAAQFMPRYLPGPPNLVPQNTPGASGLRVAELISNISPRDGTAIGITQPQMVLNKVLDPNGRYRPQDFGWIGRLGSFMTFIVVRRDAPVQSLADAKAKKLIVSGAAPSGPGVMVPMALNRLIGTKFSIVSGYKSAQDSGLALERGEVEGIGSAAFEFVDSKGWLKTGFARMLFTIGLTRHAQFPDTPTVVELIDDPRDASVMKLIVVGSAIGRAFIAPPGVPPDRLAAQREAFDKMVRDPEFIAESTKRGFDVDPMTGVELQKMVADAMSVGDDVAQRTRDVTRLDGAN